MVTRMITRKNTWQQVLKKGSKGKETHQHQSQISKIILTSKKIKSLSKNSTEFEKNDKVLEDMKWWESGFAFYCISRCQHPAIAETFQYKAEANQINLLNWKIWKVFDNN